MYINNVKLAQQKNNCCVVEVGIYKLFWAYNQWTGLEWTGQVDVTIVCRCPP